MEPTVTLGDVISIATFIISGAAVYVRLAERLTALEIKVSDLWERRFVPRVHEHDGR